MRTYLVYRLGWHSQVGRGLAPVTGFMLSTPLAGIVLLTSKLTQTVYHLTRCLHFPLLRV
jgi:hypothetical protein